MVGEMLAVIDMLGANRWCINRLKDRTIFKQDDKEYIIFWVESFAVKLYEIDSWKETDWIDIPDFQKWYKETEYCLVLEGE